LIRRSEARRPTLSNTIVARKRRGCQPLCGDGENL
jgi:hypothetical protein